MPPCFQQDVCRVRSAKGGRVLPSEECRQPGWKGHAHHSQTRPHVPAPPLGAQRRRPLNRRERQTLARHTQVTTAGRGERAPWCMSCHVPSLHKTNFLHVKHENTNGFIPFKHSLYFVYKLYALAFFLVLFVLETSFSFSITHSRHLSLVLGLAPVCPMQCFQRRSSSHRWWQQKVIIPLQYWVHGDGVLLALFSPSFSYALTLILILDIHFPSFTSENRSPHGHWSLLWWRERQQGSV